MVIFIAFTIKIGSLALEGEPPLFFFFVLAPLKLVTASTHVYLDGECFSMNNGIVTEPAQYSIFIRSVSVQNLSYNNRRNLACILIKSYGQ